METKKVHVKKIKAQVGPGLGSIGGDGGCTPQD